ncbi:hypothetical protein Scep_026223 [Stephania cephalantha]|uniref:Pentatricopeptide repeat-containing protein n=1 Tax=Stephania cephalantha TaxID=152367 RepID=A0AAP0HQ62_9MAGN
MASISTAHHSFALPSSSIPNRRTNNPQIPHQYNTPSSNSIAKAIQSQQQIDALAKSLEQSAFTLSAKPGTKSHALLIRLGFSNDVYLSSKLLDFYCRIGDVAAAQKIFDSVPKALLNQFFWNTMIRACVDCSMYGDAIDFFSKMVVLGFKPNEFTYPFVLKACSVNGVVGFGREVHGLMVVSGYDRDVFAASALLDLYVKCGCFWDASKMFDKMPERNEITWNAMVYGLARSGYWREALEGLDVMGESGIEVKATSWNSIMAGCVSCGEGVLAFETLRRMLVSGSRLKPNNATFNTLLDVIPTDVSLIQLKELHGFVLKHLGIIGINYVDYDRLCSSIVAGYAFHGSMVSASRLFHGINLKTSRLWISMISGFIECDQSQEAFWVFRNMIVQYDGEFNALSKVPLTLLLPECSPTSLTGLEIHGHAYRAGFEANTSVCNALMAMYSRRGNIELAERVFRMNPDKDTVSWNTLISSHANKGEFDKAFNLFHQMYSNHLLPDEFTLSSIISGCGTLGAHRQGVGIHGYAIKSGFSDGCLVIQNSVLDMYGKCGCTEEARNLFDEMTYKDDVSWNTMISCYGINALPHEAISLFHEMQVQGWKPNCVTFITLLSACSHAGLVGEALHFLESMTTNYGIIPDVDHYACVVDTLGRAGKLNEAYNLINSMPVKPDDCVWGALLSACRIQGNVPLAEVAASRLIELKPKHPGYHVLLSNIYKDASQWNEAMQVRAAMKEKGVKKFPGCSWTEIRGEIHNFLTADKTHAKTPAIYSTLDSLTSQLMSEGYVPSVGAKILLIS